MELKVVKVADQTMVAVPFVLSAAASFCADFHVVSSARLTLSFRPRYVCLDELGLTQKYNSFLSSLAKAGAAFVHQKQGVTVWLAAMDQGLGWA